MIDVGGRYVTPGFVDPHTHSDLTVLTDPGAESVVYQGVTTHVVGNCGMSAAPVDDHRLADFVTMWESYFAVPRVTWRSFAEYLDTIAAGGCAINVAALVGHGALRIAAMGFDERAAGERELAVMKALLAEGMSAGAFGLSAGLVYPPGCYSSTAELVALARVVKRYDGLYATHVRGERETIVAAVEEAVSIGRQSGLPVQVSHNAPKWGGPPAAENLAVIDRARAEGLDVTLDNDTHTELAPRLSRALPQPLHSLPVDELLAVLGEPARRAAPRPRHRRRRRPARSGLRRPRASRALRAHRHLARPRRLAAGPFGRRHRRAARPRRPRHLPRPDRREPRYGGGHLRVHRCRRARRGAAPPALHGLLRRPVQPLPQPGEPAAYWPCSFGEYPGLLERFVRDRAVLRLEEAVRKMTSLPAQRFGLWDRGVLRPGARADLVVFDLDRVRDRATNPAPHTAPFANVPHRFAEGMDYVFVNGCAVVWEGVHTGVRGGAVLRGPGWRA